MKFFIGTAILVALAGSAWAWSGTDQNGSTVEIGRGETVRQGRDIEVEIDGRSQNLSVDSVRRYGGRVEIEGTDDSGNSVTLHMDGD